MLINELSKRTGVSIHTLRYYENYGLIKGVTDNRIQTNNYKNYDESYVEIVEWILQSKNAGFTLNEIKEYLTTWYNKRLSVSKKTEIVQKKIGEIDAKIKQLKQMRKTLTEAIQDIENGDC